MLNLELNLGGVIGAVLCGGITLAVIIGPDPNNQRIALGTKVALGAMIGGGCAGNSLWSKLFPKKESNPETTHEE